MNRNSEVFTFSAPSVDIGRSAFNLDHRHLTTMDSGKLIPIFCEEILPGDTMELDISSLVRMSTSIFPTMDTAYLDTYFFFVPNRLTWEHWKEFCGENNTSYWAPSVEYNVPKIITSDVAVQSGDLADYFGIPVDVLGLEFSALRFRAYTLIWNNFFRDQNTMQPAYCPLDDSNREFESTAEMRGGVIPYEYAHLGTAPLPVCRYFDYFSSCLPAPQKGPAVGLPLYQDAIPVFTGPERDTQSFNNYPPFKLSVLEDNPTRYQLLGLSGGENRTYDAITASVDSTDLENGVAVYPNNLYADVSNVAVATVNQLRTAFQIQKLYEKDAMFGSRYFEILRGHFGVTSPDSRLQLPEYLGGKRIPLNMDQVLQTSSTDSTSPLGTTAGFSVTSDQSSCFTKSFVEHGYIIGVCAIRVEHTYQQGLRRHWSRSRRFDYYYPSLANIGNTAVLKKELFAQGNASDEEAFGYQEAWAEYRYSPNIVTGGFRSSYSNFGLDLDAWHYADFYPRNSEVGLNAEWMLEDSNNIKRTLAVPDGPSFLCDFFFKCKAVRPMPLYSVPGLIDHH